MFYLRYLCLSSHPVVCRRAHVLFMLFMFTCALCCLCFVFHCLVLPVSLDCPFLITPSVFSNVYLLE
jgi:hypothetical protein